MACTYSNVQRLINNYNQIEVIANMEKPHFIILLRFLNVKNMIS